MNQHIPNQLGCREYLDIIDILDDIGALGMGVTDELLTAAILKFLVGITFCLTFCTDFGWTGWAANHSASGLSYQSEGSAEVGINTENLRAVDNCAFFKRAKRLIAS